MPVRGPWKSGAFSAALPSRLQLRGHEMAALPRIFPIPGMAAVSHNWKATSQDLPQNEAWKRRQQALALVQQADRFERNRAHDRQALGAELIHSVFGSVVENVVVAIFKID
jgi:hypothetical protein